MSAVDRFRTALLEHQSGTLDTELLPERLARACVDALPVAGAGISLVDDDFRVPLGGSDDTASYAERLQFTLGEGPCLQAASSTEPVRVNGPEMVRQWPLLYADMISHTPYRAVVSMPLMRSETGRGGAIDLYLEDPDGAGDLDTAEARIVADTVAALLSISAATAAADLGPRWLDAPVARRRRRVWVAIGLVSVECDIAAHDALSILRAHTFAHARSLDGLAEDLVNGTVSAKDL